MADGAANIEPASYNSKLSDAQDNALAASEASTINKAPAAALILLMIVALVILVLVAVAVGT